MKHPGCGALMHSCASDSLPPSRCLSNGLVSNEDQSVQKFLREKIQAEHVSALAWLVQTVESTLDTGGAKSKVVSSLGSDLSTFAAELMGMSHELIMSGTLSHEMFHGVLLRELGLNAHCWPLQVGACVALACSIWTFNSVILKLCTHTYHLPLTTYHLPCLPLTT